MGAFKLTYDLSINPKATGMPWQSPYCSMDNNSVIYNYIFGDWVSKSDSKENIKLKKEEGDSKKSLYKFLEGKKIWSKGLDRGIGIGAESEYDDAIKSLFKPINKDKAIFGKKIIRYGFNTVHGETTHGSVYFGKDKSGNEYTFTKNGWKVAPAITKVSEIELMKRYRPVTPLTGYGYTDFYNKK